MALVNSPHSISSNAFKKNWRANIQKTEAKLLHLNNPMDRNLPLEVMIRDIEDVQRFLLANRADNMELTDVQLCTHGLIKLYKTGGLYANATERWNLKYKAIRQQWMEFKTHFIAEYEKMRAASLISNSFTFPLACVALSEYCTMLSANDEPLSSIALYTPPVPYTSWPMVVPPFAASIFS